MASWPVEPGEIGSMFSRTKFATLGLLIILLLVVGSNTSRASEELFVYLPLLTKPPAIINGDFESGPVAWGQYSSNGWALIVQSDELLVPPHGGSWAVWLGGDDNEDSIVWQVVAVPTTNSLLRYWIWIASGDNCGYDMAGVVVNMDAVVDAYWLCDANNTGGWIERVIDLGAYAGQTVELDFAAFTDDSINSNLFIDDVSLGLASARDEETNQAGSNPAAAFDVPKARHLVESGSSQAAEYPGHDKAFQLRAAFEAWAGDAP